MCIIVTKIFRIYFLNRLSKTTLGEMSIAFFGYFFDKNIL
jgi:hypothetical protein